MTQSLRSLPCFVTPCAGPKSLVGKIGLATKIVEGDPFPIRVEFHGVLNGEGDSRRSTIALNYSELELLVLGGEKTQ